MFSIFYEDQGEALVDSRERFRAFIEGDPDGLHGYGPTPNQAVEDLLPSLAKAGLSTDRKDYEIRSAPTEEAVEAED